MNLHAKKSYNKAFPEATARGVVFSFEGNLKDLLFFWLSENIDWKLVQRILFNTNYDWCI